MNWCAVISNGSLEKSYEKDPFLNCDFWIEVIQTDRKGYNYITKSKYSIDEYVIHSCNFNIQDMAINGWKINKIRDAENIVRNGPSIIANIADPRGKEESVHEFSSDFLGVSKIIKKILLLSKYSSWAVSRQVENSVKANPT